MFVAVGCVPTSESVRGASVSVDHPPGVARSAAGHASAVVEGLALPGEARALLLAC